MKRIYPYRYKEQEVWVSGHYTPNIVICFNKAIKGVRQLMTGVGRANDYDLFQEGDRIYLLSVNRTMDYVGLTMFDLAYASNNWEDESKKRITADREIFFQEQEQYGEILGPRGLELTDRTILRRLLPYLGQD